MENNEIGFEIEMDVIEIEKEDGTLEECGIQKEFKIGDRSYIVLSPIGEDNFLINETIYYFREAYDGEDLMLEDIEAEEELRMVKEKYEALLSSAMEEM